MKQQGQILAELLVCLALVIGFLTFSLVFYQDLHQASYRHMLTQIKDNK